MQKLTVGFAFTGLLTAMSCGGSSGGGSSATAGSTILIKDAPLAGLETFRVTFTKVVLLGAGGTSDITMLSTATTVDLLTLSINSDFLSGGSVPVGRYSGLQVTVSAINATATGNVTLTFDDAGSLPFVVPVTFAETLVVVAGTPFEILIDFDVQRSYGETGATTFTMIPVMKPDTSPIDQEIGLVIVKVVSIDVANNTFMAVTTDATARSIKININNAVPYVVDYTNVYIGAAEVMAALNVNDILQVEEGRFSAGALTPFFLLKGANAYPTNFGIIGGTISSVNTTANTAVMTVEFASDDQTGGLLTAKASINGTVNFVWNDANTKLLLSKYGTTVSAGGDSITNGMFFGMGGAYDPATNTMTPILAILEPQDLRGSIASFTNVSGTIYDVALTSVWLNGQSVANQTIKFDSALGKFYRAGKQISDFTRIAVGDSFQGFMGYNFATARRELAKGRIGSKETYSTRVALQVATINVSSDPFTFEIDITDSNALAALGESGTTRILVKLPLDAGVYSHDINTNTGKQVNISDLATFLTNLADVDHIVLNGFYEGGAGKVFHADELFISIR